MAVTASELLMNADLYRMAFPEWPGVPARAQALVPADADRGECGHFADENGPVHCEWLHEPSHKRGWQSDADCPLTHLLGSES